MGGQAVEDRERGASLKVAFRLVEMHHWIAGAAECETVRSGDCLGHRYLGLLGEGVDGRSSAGPGCDEQRLDEYECDEGRQPRWLEARRGAAWPQILHQTFSEQVRLFQLLWMT